MTRLSSEGFSTDDRSTSEVVAVALLFGIVMVSVATIVLVAGAQLDGSQEAAEVGQAERSLTQFDSATERVATGSTSSQTIDLGLKGNSGTLDADPDRGRITVVSIDSLDDGSRTEVMNTSLGTVSYENGDTTVAYQSGGVWRSDGNGSVMVSPPEVSFTGKTLTMHVVESDRSGSIHSEVQLSRSGPSEQRYPNASAGLDNRVENSLIEVKIRSRYYEAWGQFFEERTNTIVQYNDQAEEVTMLFLALPVDYSPEAGVVATSGPGQIRIEGSGSYIDSYNSSNGTYEETRHGDGRVKSAGKISMYGGSRIEGDAEADDDIRIESGDAQIDGNASSGQQVDEHDDSSVTGEVRNNTSGVPPVPPIDGLVQKKVNELEGDNDNDATEVVTDNEIDLSESNELDPGDYYLENVELEDETLVLNATDGNITLGVENWVKLHGNKKSGNIRIKGDGKVRVFVGSEKKTTVNPPSEGKTKLHFYVERSGSVRTVDTPRQRSTQFVVFGPSDFEGSLGGSSSKNPNVTAVVIAPAGPQGDGTFHLKHGELYGAVMTGNLTLGKPSAIHFDEAIVDERIPLSPTVPRLEYLYVTEHEIAVARR
ncbi:DUF7289 family protein [Halobellus ordinarius]|uniref:DUF7289 family protein n=1 Tax=Halobellus ordinarius TaxID=3075120 RepID=UPI00288041AE|nr:hypothetical protein [Halobellus sp. ZY16]